MTDWNPKEEMGWFQYLKFKNRRWVEVDTLPDWVHEANDGYFRGYVEKYGHKPYDEEKYYTGDSLKYKIYYNAVAQGDIRTEYYVKLKD